MRQTLPMPTPEVTLREVTAETVRLICDLDSGPGGDQFVAPNAVSIAQAHFEPSAWFRAIYAGDEPVGFVMLEDDVENREYTLWRLMIDHRHQRKGYGRRAVELVIDYVTGRPDATELLTSYVPGDAGPAEFYRRLGFTPTGAVDEGEIVVKLSLASRG
jgi:diamine N-acetyltransferase